MKKSMTTASTVVFFVVTAAGCFPNVGGNIFVRADSADFAGTSPAPAPLVSSTPAVATGLSDADLAKIGEKVKDAIPTPAPTATPSPTPTPPPGERIREGVWVRPRTAEDPKDGPDRADGNRLTVRLTGEKRDPLVRRPRSSPGDKPWIGVGYLGLVPEEKGWLGITYDAERDLFWIFGSKIVVAISEEAFLTE